MRTIGSILAIVGALLAPVPARADNTTSATAYSLVVGGTPAEALLDGTHTHRWYATNVVQDRAYCAETQGGVHLDASATTVGINTTLNVFKANGVTVLGTSTDIDFSEPGGNLLSRVCFVAAVTEKVFINVDPVGASATFNFRVRIVETTLFSNWFFLGGDYNAYTIIRNTTSSPAFVSLRWRRLDGTILNTIGITIPADGGVYRNARDSVPNSNLPANQTGTVEIFHALSPRPSWPPPPSSRPPRGSASTPCSSSGGDGSRPPPGGARHD